ncbi:ADP-ribosyl-[dinitrogen reductase] glycohydrolase [Bacteroidales bacterium Barb6]|nr:ADP-ribosyl-[dinitrogen reductase] glycohydrolase [Bacteroidales bacterium Barb6]
MLGAIIGDIVGSRFEFDNTDETGFELFTEECDFTDDTVCTVAIADALLNGKSYRDSLVEWCRKYPNPMGAYGAGFKRWIFSSGQQPYNSYGNGSAMRVSPVGWLHGEREEVIRQAAATACVSHNHPEGVKGAVAVALAVFAGRNGVDKRELPDYLRKHVDGFDYELGVPVDVIRKTNTTFDPTCQGSVPQALNCFLESRDFEDCIRLAVSIGGDSDTIACMAGSVAEAFYGKDHIPLHIIDSAMRILPDDMKRIIEQFEKYK